MGLRGDKDVPRLDNPLVFPRTEEIHAFVFLAGVSWRGLVDFGLPYGRVGLLRATAVVLSFLRTVLRVLAFRGKSVYGQKDDRPCQMVGYVDHLVHLPRAVVCVARAKKMHGLAELVGFKRAFNVV